MNAEALTTVRVSKTFKASAERVFDAWLDASKAGRWLFATPTGQVVRSEIDGRVGGKFVIVDRRDGVDVEHVGTYLEIDRPKRLVFTFGVPKYSKDLSKVTIEIAALDSGCRLTLTNELVPPEYTSGTEAGWKAILVSLDRVLGA